MEAIEPNPQLLDRPPAGTPQFIALCTPTLGMVSLDWAMCTRPLQWPPNVGQLAIPVRDVVGDEIAECRNRVVMLALQMCNDGFDVTHLFWLDDDVLVTPFALKRLMSHNRDIASGVYFFKEDINTPLIFPGKCCGTTPFVPNQVFETWGHGMGLTLVKLEVYRRMAQELDLPRDKYGNFEWYRTKRSAPSEMEGRPVICGGWSEDLYFLDLAGTLGFKPIVDTHRDAFGWHFDPKTRVGYPREQFEQFKASQPITWPTPDGPKTW